MKRGSEKGTYPTCSQSFVPHHFLNPLLLWVQEKTMYTFLIHTLLFKYNIENNTSLDSAFDMANLKTIKIFHLARLSPMGNFTET